MFVLVFVSLLIVALLAVSFGFALREREPPPPPPPPPVVVQAVPAVAAPADPLPSAAPAPPPSTYIGCFASYGSPMRTMDSLTLERDVSESECGELAAQKNYQYYAVFQGECKGSNDLTFASEPMPEAECFREAKTIIGSNVASVFRNERYNPRVARDGPARIPIAYKGCYADADTNRALPVLLGTSVPSVDACAKFANDAGLKYFGLQAYGGQCWGGASWFDATKHGLRTGDDACRWECKPLDPTRSADNSVKCGSMSTNALYENLLV
jgi:hypothetical protein